MRKVNEVRLPQEEYPRVGNLPTAGLLPTEGKD